uniref:DUF7792 domain-containing protein n=1 Tax=Fagus sylvatica TaxID=28930 RepID=A0A2N9GV05_FAGSY
MAEEKSLQEELSLPTLLSDRVSKSAREAESCKADCSELAKQVDRLGQMLRSTVRLSQTHQSLYERPIRRIVADVAKNLERAQTLVRKCKHSGVLRQVFSITTTADFRKVSNLLESSIGDVKWLLSIFDSEGGTNLSLPPIASNDPILSWVWAHTATVLMGQPKDRTDAAQELASLAKDNDRNKKIIVEELGVPPLLKLLNEGSSNSPESQIAAATALFNIVTDRERVRHVVEMLGIPIIVHVLTDSPIKVQISVANLVARMAERDPVAQEEFARENVTRPLVSTLAMDTILDDPNFLQSGKTSIHSLVQLAGKTTPLPQPKNTHTFSFGSNSASSDGVSRGGGGAHYHYNSNARKERDTETPEVKLKVKVSCAEALWKLSKGSLVNSRKITETKGLLCLAKMIEVEKEELQYNCLMTVMEIAAVAESNTELRRAAFKPSSPPAKAVLDQLLRVVQVGGSSDSWMLQIPAIKTIGCLARTFPARETRIIGPLVLQLGNKNVDVATEAAIALGKFVCPENFNCLEHSNAILEFNGVPLLMKLWRANEWAQMHGVVLLCYLALNVGTSKALEQARALNELEGAARSVLAQNPNLRDLIAQAMAHLTLYQPGVPHPHRMPYAP